MAATGRLSARPYASASGLAGLVVGRVGRETGREEEPVTPPGDKEVGEVGGALSPGRTTEAAEGIAASQRLRWRRPPSDGGECGAVVTAAAPRFCDPFAGLAVLFSCPRPSRAAKYWATKVLQLGRIGHELCFCGAG